MRVTASLALWFGSVLLAAPFGTASQAGAQQGVGAVGSRKEPIRQRLQQGSTLGKVDVNERLGKKVPHRLTFTNHRGEKVRLGEFFGSGPVLLTFNYYTCPVLCSLLLESTAKAVTGVPWTAGDEFEIVTISIDPRDTPERAAKKRDEILDTYGKSRDGWHFLVGKAPAIREAAEAAGIEYTYKKSRDQYAHPAVITFLTPEGRLARYLYGLNLKTKDVRLALFEAARGRTLSTGEQLILCCYTYDPDEGGYALVGYRVMQYGGGATIALLGGGLALLWRRERSKRR